MLTVLVLVVFGAQAQGSDFSSVVSTAKRSVVQILEGESVVGTGFFVRPDIIATNVHVMAALSKPQIQNFDGVRSGSLSILAFDHQRDLALVRVANKGTPLKVAQNIPAPGSEVLALGHPRGLEMTATSGTVSAIRKQAGLIQTDAAVNPGNSGGPLIDKNGRVVGAVVSRIAGAEGLGFAVPIQFVEQMLKSDNQALTLEQFLEALYSDPAYVEGILQALPKRFKEANGKGIWKLQTSSPERLVFEHEYVYEDQSVGMSWTIDVKRKRAMIYTGFAAQSRVCFIPGTPQHKVCNLQFPVALRVKDGAVNVQAEYGKLNCERCALENTTRQGIGLVAASSSDQAIATGAASAIQRADDARANRENQQRRAAAAAQQQSANRACAAAMEMARQNCGRGFALEAYNCGQAQSNIESFCR